MLSDFYKQQHDALVSSSILTSSYFQTFFYFLAEKRHQRKSDVEKVRQKTAEALKVINISKFQMFEQWEKCLGKCIDSNGENCVGY